MNVIDSCFYISQFLKYVNMSPHNKFTDEMYSWIINIAGNNTSDLVRLLKLVRDVSITFGGELTLQTVSILCSAPYYLDFIPFLRAMSEKNIQAAIKNLLMIWKRGYAYEDILESFQTINNLFGTGCINDNTLIHKFLINAWISYCKGNTSILALQNVVCKTLTDST
jgi:DNA polymerase III gamma/tau subunit